MFRVAVLTALFPGAAFAACPEGGSLTPFTLSGGWGATSSIYPQADDVTVMRVQAENGRIDEIAFHRGLLLVAERSAAANYTVDYRGDVAAIFDLEAGSEVTLQARQVSPTAERIFAETYSIGETVTLDIGGCRYDATIIDSVGETEDGPLPRVRVYYASALGFVLGREVFYEPDGEVPQVSLFFEGITSDPAALVPR